MQLFRESAKQLTFQLLITSHALAANVETMQADEPPSEGLLTSFTAARRRLVDELTTIPCSIHLVELDPQILLGDWCRVSDKKGPIELIYCSEILLLLDGDQTLLIVT